MTDATRRWTQLAGSLAFALLLLAAAVLLLLFAAGAVGAAAPPVPAPDEVRLEDAARFPPPECCEPFCKYLWDCWAYNRDHASKATTESEFMWFDAAARHADWLWYCWVEAKVAGMDSEESQFRLGKLRSLRRRIGPENYEAGLLPCPVPWEFLTLRE